MRTARLRVVPFPKRNSVKERARRESQTRGAPFPRSWRGGTSRFLLQQHRRTTQTPREDTDKEGPIERVFCERASSTRASARATRRGLRRRRENLHPPAFLLLLPDRRRVSSRGRVRSCEAPQGTRASSSADVWAVRGRLRATEAEDSRVPSLSGAAAAEVSAKRRSSCSAARWWTAN